MPLPEGVWEAEKNESNIDLAIRQSGVPSTACLNIKVIYNSGFATSSGGTANAQQRALDVVREAEKYYNDKFSSSNRLGTRITFNVIGGK